MSSQPVSTAARPLSVSKAPRPIMPLHVEAFLHGTHWMSCDVVGAYVRLLLHQWAHGSVPGDDLAAVGAILHVSRRKAHYLWSRVGPKFIRASDATWRNLRLDETRRNAVEFSERQQARARLRWKRHALPT